MIDERLTDLFAGTEDHVEDSGRQLCLRINFAELSTGKRRLYRRLVDDSIACEQCSARHACRQSERKIEGGDDDENAVGAEHVLRALVGRKLTKGSNVTVSRLYGRSAAPFVSVIGFAAACHRAQPIVDRVNRLEGYLARIGDEVRAAGVVPHRPTVSFTELSELTERQNEIVRRLVGGQRVAAIARDLFVSPSTVRNHLSAIYRALGVNSQSELIRRILTQGPATGESND